MTRLLLLLLLLTASPAWAAIAEVGAGSQRGSGSGFNAATADCAFPGNVTSGNVIVVAGGLYNDVGTVGAITTAKTAGTATIGAVSTILSSTGVFGGRMKAWISYALVTGTGSLTMRVSPDIASSNYMRVACDEFSGTNITLDVNGGEAVLASATPVSDTITTAAANALIVGVTVPDSSVASWTAGTGYTLIGSSLDSATQIYAAEFKIATTATAYAVDFAFTGGGTLNFSVVNAAFKEVAGDTTPPTVPANLVGTATGSDRISLAWTASTDNIQTVVTYRLERAPFSGACGAYAEIAQPLTNAYLDTGLTASTSYCYRVRASDGANLSAYSTATTVATLAFRSLNLAWDDNAPNAQNATAETGFQLERCTGAACSDFTTLATLGQNVTTYTDAVSPNPIAGYRVTALPAGQGYSNIVYSTPAASAIMAVFPPLLTFAAAPGANPVSQSLAISKNVGGPTMTWSITDDAAWLTVAPSSGTDNALVTVSVNTAGLVAGVYTATITITANATGSPAAIPVTLTMSSANSGSSGRIK